MIRALCLCLLGFASVVHAADFTINTSSADDVVLQALVDKINTNRPGPPLTVATYIEGELVRTVERLVATAQRVTTTVSIDQVTLDVGRLSAMERNQLRQFLGPKP